MTDAFEVSRDDGRSDGQVIFDLAVHKQPGTTLSYERIIRELETGLPPERTVGRPRVYAAVTAANRKLLHECNRYLKVVRNEGYRLLHGSEHLPVAMERKSRANTQFRKGLEILRNTDMAELDPTARAMHQGQLHLMAGLYHAAQESARRADRIEDLIQDVSRRVDKLEDGK